MDPNETLKEIRDLIEQFDITPYSEDALLTVGDQIVGKFQALDTWLSAGGFLPDAWGNALGTVNPKVSPVKVVEPEPHIEIWCQRCAKGNHYFFDQNGRPVENCNCCGEEKS